MSDESTPTDEAVQAHVTPADQQAQPGEQQPVAVDHVLAQQPAGEDGGAEDEQGEEAEGAEEEADVIEPQSVPVGHSVVQDNVTEPGVEHTHQVAGDGSVTTSSHSTLGEDDEEEGEGEGEAAEDEDGGDTDDEE